ncbi:CAP domain-containing protein [Streptomyces sp. NPDC058467]|uniref:CAP domain-containing protein n=1 Tax=Streptomyces sp. NPDC058467 TaxID=3346513 RepID=UPI003664DC56
MSKHRRKTRHRQMTIAAVAVSALAIPTAAMACLNDEGATTTESYGQWRNWTNASLDERGNGGEEGWKGSDDPWKGGEGGWNGGGWTSRPTAPASPETTAPASPAPAAPQAPASTTHAAPKAPASTATTAPKAPVPAPSATAKAAPASAAVARIVALVNSERSKVGCSALTLNAKLSKAAQAHSADMASHQNMSHTGSDGSDPGERITRAGYIWSAYGENVAYGYSTPEQVMAGWMSSPGHKRNILDCGFKEIGVGLAQPGSYWTQDFGTSR